MSDLEPIYRCIRQNLLANRDHVARIVGGAACEQWFNAEAFAAINWPAATLLPSGHCGMAEHRKRDLILRDDAERTIATVESKVVHNNKNLWDKLAELHGQVVRDSYDDEVPHCNRGGLVYVVWGDYFTRCEVKTQTEFHAVVLAEIDRLFPVGAYRHMPAIGLDEIVPATKLSWPGQAYWVSLYTKFVQRKNCAT
jgi:hypothetical protein